MRSTLLMFLLAALLEIGGCFTFWQWLRNGRSAAWAVLGVGLLAGFAWALTRAETEFAGRAYAAYGGIYIASAIGWLWLVEGRRPDLWDLGGATLCLAGTLVILLGSRG